MKYMVMECHPGYAVVMDNAGRFLKVANLHYEVGQTVTSVLKMTNAGTSNDTKDKRLRKMWMSVASLAACLCLVVFGSWTFLMSPYGSVRMQINPDVEMTVNRLDYVISLDGLNDDGDDLIEDYSYRWKKVDVVFDELTDRAAEMGYLKEDGTIRITVESKHEKWKTETEERMTIKVEDYMKASATASADSSDDSDKNSFSDENKAIIPSRPAQPPSDDDNDDDDDDDDDDDRDDDADDDDTDDNDTDDSGVDDDIGDNDADDDDVSDGDSDDDDTDSGSDDTDDGEDTEPDDDDIEQSDDELE